MNVFRRVSPLALLVLALPAGAAAHAGSRAGCASSLAGEPASTTQLITVEAAGTGTTYATVRLWRRDGRCWVAASGPFPARLGARGLSSHHVEGDLTTPTGVYAIGPVMYGIAANPGLHYTYHRLVCGDWWDEDPSSSTYNTFRHVGCGASPPFHGGSEALWTETNVYQSFAVIQYNAGPIVPGRGSAIFLHGGGTSSPTTGCVKLSSADLDVVLRWLRPADRPLIAIGTASQLRS
jgi:L,D-peptidoglycan transpeptidase YkuD (ErfK/YbiS/YcfS/YnhG family)